MVTKLGLPLIKNFKKKTFCVVLWVPVLEGRKTGTSIIYAVFTNTRYRYHGMSVA